jgi:hypothetical protein
MFVRTIRPRVDWTPLRSSARLESVGRGDLGELQRRLAEAGIGAPSATLQDFTGPGAALAAVARPMTMAEALETIGVPSIAGSPEHELAELLKFAAEIEHGLMAQYLYALYSAQQGSVKGALMLVAIEEMGHLITVQNLLAAAGEPPWLGRYDWSQSPFAPFAFRLEPASRLSIAKYAVCEMPEIDSPDITAAQHVLLPDILKDARTSADGVDPIRIGLLYAKIYWLLRRDDLPLANPDDEPWSNFPVSDFAASPTLKGRHVKDASFAGPAEKQAEIDPWQSDQNSVIVHAVSSRDDALAAVSDVAEQGEGFGSTPDGHFDHFVTLYEQIKDQSGIAYAVPTDPWYGTVDPPGRDPLNKITSPDGEKFARLADQVYALILLSTALFPLLPASADPAHRKGVGQAALALMQGGMRQIGLILPTIERDGAAAGLVAAMCFGQPAEGIAGEAAAVLAQIKSLLDEAVTTAEQIAATTTVLTRKNKAKQIAGSLRNDARPLFDQIEI